jgi:hypothetical protein
VGADEPALDHAGGKAVAETGRTCLNPGTGIRQWAKPLRPMGMVALAGAVEMVLGKVWTVPVR